MTSIVNDPLYTAYIWEAATPESVSMLCLVPVEAVTNCRRQLKVSDNGNYGG
jgi:hypothetical protein